LGTAEEEESGPRQIAIKRILRGKRKRGLHRPGKKGNTLSLANFREGRGTGDAKENATKGGTSRELSKTKRKKNGVSEQ